MWLAMAAAVGAADALYVGDYSDNSVKVFNAETGAFQERFVKSQGGIHSPNGIVFDPSGNLLLANQNANTGIAGEILQFDGRGKLLSQLVKSNRPDGPWAPQGIILVNGILFVADLQSKPTAENPIPPGTLRRYDSSGAFLGAWVPDPLVFVEPFHPRGVVHGPDGYIYVSNVPNLPAPAGTGLGGQVLRFRDDGTFVDSFISSAGGVGALNRPSGLVFGPDGKRLYVTSFRANPGDNDKILIYEGRTLVDWIDLDVAAGARAFAQALLFGPGGKLFVPISNTGEVRRYDVATKQAEPFVAPGGTLELPWFLTFGKSSPGTLGYPSSR
jgi:DNA-binding beta-propeller fold protein YncE